MLPPPTVGLKQAEAVQNQYSRSGNMNRATAISGYVDENGRDTGGVADPPTKSSITRISHSFWTTQVISEIDQDPRMLFTCYFAKSPQTPGFRTYRSQRSCSRSIVEPSQICTVQFHQLNSAQTKGPRSFTSPGLSFDMFFHVLQP